MSRTLHRRRSYVCLTSSHTHNTETLRCKNEIDESNPPKFGKRNEKKVGTKVGRIGYGTTDGRIGYGFNNMKRLYFKSNTQLSSLLQISKTALKLLLV